METRHFVDIDGNYLGGFGTGAEPTVPALEVSAPPHGDCVWNAETGWEWPQDRLSARVRAERDAILSQTDWTQAPDATVDRAAWSAYRQALRDVTSQPGFPADVVWPEPPGKSAVARVRRTPLTRRQLFLGLYRLGILTAEEAVAAVTAGQMPARLAAAGEGLPEEQRVEFAITFASFIEANSDDPMVIAMAAAAGIEPDQIDALWDRFTLI